MLTSSEELTEKKQQLSFKQFIEETYLPWYKTQVKESTYLNRRSTIQKHFSYFYKMTVDEIKPSNVQNWQLELAKEFNPNYILPRALEKPAGLAGVHRIKIHALRHSHASMLIDMGFDILEISERLGHESVKTTLDTYSHLYPEKDTKLAGELNKLRRPAADES